MSRETRTSVFNDKTLIPVGVLTIIVAGVVSIVTWGNSLSAQVQANSDTNDQQDKNLIDVIEQNEKFRERNEATLTRIDDRTIQIQLDVQDLKTKSEVE